MNVTTGKYVVALSLFAVWTGGGVGWVVAAAGEAQVSYNQDIQPLLANYCYKCHGSDKARRQAGLRLDVRSAAFGQLPEGGRAIVAGRPHQSKLWLRVASSDPEQRMPPAEFGKQLSDAQRESLKRWIEQGARWPAHWAYTAPGRPKLPAVKQFAWPRNAIDSFTLAAMERRSWRPSPAASRRALLRRVTLDLTGLPPSPAEMTAFLTDRSPRAYEKAVERLLQSPRFGERMAVHWLDLARYADTHGYHTDSHRDMWRWRQWVVEAFNRNLPFDEFTTEQLAGDLLKNPTLDQLIATGFNRNNMVNFENGALEKEYQTEYVIDRVVTTATVWLGQTFQCARCHDHKYDPISQLDFYKLYAYFNRLPEKGLDGDKGNAIPFIKAPTRDQRRRQETLTTRLLALNAALSHRAAQSRKDIERWEQRLRSGKQQVPQPPMDATAHYRFENEKQPARDETKHARHGRVIGTPLLLPDKFNKAILFSGDLHIDLGDQVADIDRDEPLSFSVWVMPTAKQPMLLVSRFDENAKTGIQLSIIDQQLSLRLQHDGEHAIHVGAMTAIRQNRWQHIGVTYSGGTKAADVRLFVDGRLRSVEILKDSLDASIKTSTATCIGDPEGHQPFRGMMDEVRFYARELSDREVKNLADGLPVAAILAIASEKRSASQLAELKQYFIAQVDPAGIELRAQRREVMRLQENLDRAIPTTMVMRDMKDPRPSFFLRRGNYQYPQQQVKPATPAALPRLGDFSADRLGLAEWLTDRRHPLTARVTVNRFWQMLFAEGLVRTPEDFGTRGQPPTHPLLLDWLAVEFMESGWDVKHILRLIVTSATYRQSSRTTDWHRQHDPDNRWLTRAPRVRLPAEFIRDSALAASGLLQEQLGGLSVHPYQPLGLWKDVSFNPRDYTAQIYTRSNGSSLYRRSLYTFWKRAVPPPSLVAFDAPDRETCTVRRSRSNSPLQALVLMNDPTYVEAARVLAGRLLITHGDDVHSIIRGAFARCLNRPPQTAEVELLQAIYAAQLADYRAQPELAVALLRVGEMKVDPKLDPCRLAAWATTLGVVLCSDEMINRP